MLAHFKNKCMELDTACHVVYYCEFVHGLYRIAINYINKVISAQYKQDPYKQVAKRSLHLLMHKLKYMWRLTSPHVTSSIQSASRRQAQSAHQLHSNKLGAATG